MIEFNSSNQLNTVPIDAEVTRYNSLCQKFCAALVNTHDVFQRAFLNSTELAKEFTNEFEASAGKLFENILRIATRAGSQETSHQPISCRAQLDALLLEQAQSTQCADLTFLVQVLQGILSYLNKEIVLEEIVFPGADFSVLEDFYTRGTLGSYNTQLYHLAISELLSSNQKPMHALELGAGTSAGTLGFLNSSDNLGSVKVTDVSQRLVRKLKKRFMSHVENSKFEFLTLDMNHYSELQRMFTTQKYDLVCALNTLHLAESPQELCACIYRELPPKGWLVLSEVYLSEQEPNHLLELSFGSLPSLYKNKESKIPLRTALEWKKLLLEVGFTSVKVFPSDEILNPKYGCVLWAQKEN